MEKENVFKWKHYQLEIILLTVRWYLRDNLSFLDLVEMMEDIHFSYNDYALGSSVWS